jgi:hypothetical protein
MLQILDIQLFVLGRYISSKTKTGDIKPLGKRIKITYETINAEDLIRSEIDGRKGRMVVSRESWICSDICIFADMITQYVLIIKPVTRFVRLLKNS